MTTAKSPQSYRVLSPEGDHLYTIEGRVEADAAAAAWAVRFNVNIEDVQIVPTENKPQRW